MSGIGPVKPSSQQREEALFAAALERPLAERAALRGTAHVEQVEQLVGTQGGSG